MAKTEAERETKPTLGALLAQHARAGNFSELATDRPWKERPLGRDFSELGRLGISARDPFVDLPPDA